MHLPRRSFLKTGTMTAVSAGIALSSGRVAFSRKTGSSNGFEIPLTAEGSPLFSFTRETFERYVGDTFQAPNARGRMVPLTLLDVQNYRAKNNTRLSTRTPREVRSFSLTFKASERLPQFTSIHKVSHRALGQFDLFLKSHAKNDTTLLYEAVFSHI